MEKNPAETEEAYNCYRVFDVLVQVYKMVDVIKTYFKRRGCRNIATR